MSIQETINNIQEAMKRLESNMTMMSLRVRAIQANQTKEEAHVALTIGQAIDMLKNGDAEKITCYTTDHTYMYFCEEKNELRTYALNGTDYPWIIKEREMEATFRVLE